MEDELKDLHCQYDELVKELELLEEMKAQCLEDPGAYYDVCSDIEAADEELWRVTNEIAALVAKKRNAPLVTNDEPTILLSDGDGHDFKA